MKLDRYVLYQSTHTSSHEGPCSPQHLSVFPCPAIIRYLLPALLKCSCPFPCSLTFFTLVPLFPNWNWPCAIVPKNTWKTLSYGLGSLDKYDSLRSSWLVYARTTCPLCDLLIFVWAHVVQARLVPEITSKMTRCSVRPTRVQICDVDVPLL
jgi:hypothetical protein